MRIISLFLVLIGCHHNSPGITEHELKSHLKTLASDSMEGRMAGTEMELKAASYIAEEYSKINLLYFGEDYLQNFEFSTGMVIGKNNKVVLFNENLKPEIRIYDQPVTVTYEASINSGFFSDTYLTMSNISESDIFNVKFQRKPFMNFIWLSVLLVSFGGIINFFNRRKAT